MKLRNWFRPSPVTTTITRARRAASNRPARFRPAIERLEDRLAPAVYIVNTTANSGAGSFRQAILDSDNTIGVLDTIKFDIGGGGAQRIAPATPLPTITDPVVIDGWTQPGFDGTPLIELNGSSAGFRASGLTISTVNCTVRGLVVNGFFDGAGIVMQVGGSHNLVESNFVGTNAAGTDALANLFGIVVTDTTSASNTIGGLGTVHTDGGLDVPARNIVSGNTNSGINVQIGASRNNILGNYIGTDVTGTMAIGNHGGGVRVSVGSNNTIQGNVISGNSIGLNIINSSNNVVQGNLIGTNEAGTGALGNLSNGSGFGPGVAIQGQTGQSAASGNLIDGNVIAANVTGVWMQGSGAHDNVVQSNYIGTNASGAAGLGNTGNGVQLVPLDANNTGANNNSIIHNNVIANNGSAGILVSNFNSIIHTTGSGVSGNLLVGNSIHDNGGLGIDIGGDGVTPNTAGGPHVGPNNLQNFPVLTAAGFGSSFLVSGTLNSAAGTTFTIDVYASPTADPPLGYGEGQYYLGSTTVTTDASGNASFTAAFSATAVPGGAVTAGWAISATATDPAHNTSEFSADVFAGSGNPLQSAADAGGTVTLQASTTADAVAAVAAVNASPATSGPVTVVLNLGNVTLSGLDPHPPARVTLVINGNGTTTTIVGHSPALTVSSGTVVITGVTFTNATDAPTILVTGGSLKLRNDVVQESTGYNQAAIEVIGGAVDLGTADDPGGNLLNLNGPGEFFQLSGTLAGAAGNTFRVDGAAIALNAAPATSPEGTPVPLSTNVTNPVVAGSFTYAWAATKNGTSFATGAGPSFALLPDDDGTYLVALTVAEDGVTLATDSRSVTATNVAPANVGLSLSAGSINENGSTTLSGSFLDPGTLDTHTVVINWGPGETPTTLNLAATVLTFSASHQYRDDNPTGTSADIYPISVTVTDKDGGSGNGGILLTVTNVAPVVGAITAPIAPVSVGTPIAASAGFTDVGTLDTHTAVWDWGDGTTTAGTISESGGSGSVANGHTYAAAGVYTVRLTVTDDDRGAGQAVFQYAVVYDPSAGFVTGGGWINSPAGAYAANPALTGKANFGFESRYQPGANVPTGNTEFQFQVAGFNFHSTAYEWMVVSGAKARYRGTGTANGAGDYGFELTAWDGQVNGGGGVDRFRIKVWDRSHGNAVVYDNQLGADDGADPTTVLGGGSIVIHT